MDGLVISETQRAFFAENGFLAIEGVLDADDLAPLEAEYAALLDEVARALFETGSLPALFEDLPFGQRYAQVIAHRPETHRRFNISLPLEHGPHDPATFHMHAGPAVFQTLRHRKLLDLVAQFIGDEIACSPVQQMRMKPPEKVLSGDVAGHSNVGATTWHQDIVALLPEADDTEQLTVWLAVTDATPENGCLISVPGSHREGPKVHCANADLASEPQIPGKLIGKKPVPLPVKKGGVVLFHKMNIHRALPNRSEDLRWSMDLRYHPVGQASGRSAFPGFTARSRSAPDTELRDPADWAGLWSQARERILSGAYQWPIFADQRWSDATVC